MKNPQEECLFSNMCKSVIAHSICFSSGLDLLATKPTISAKSNEENVRSTGSWCVSLTETYNWMTQDGTEGPCQCHLFNTKGTNSCDLLRHDMSTDASPHSHPYVQSCYRSCFPSEAMSCESRDQVHISTTPLEPKKASTGEVGQVVTLGHLNMLQTSETNAQPSPQPTSAKPTAQTSKPTIAKTSEPTSEPLPLTRGPTSPIELPTHHVVDATLATHTGASGMPTPHPTTWKSAWMWLWPNHGKNKKKKVVKADVPTSSPTMRTSVYNILTTMPMKIDVDPHESSRSIVPGDLQVPAEGKISSSRPTRYPTGGWLD